MDNAHAVQVHEPLENVPHDARGLVVGERSAVAGVERGLERPAADVLENNVKVTLGTVRRETSVRHNAGVIELPRHDNNGVEGNNTERNDFFFRVEMT